MMGGGSMMVRVQSRIDAAAPSSRLPCGDEFEGNCARCVT
jgi:hypothetical protein